MSIQTTFGNKICFINYACTDLIVRSAYHSSIFCLLHSEATLKNIILFRRYRMIYQGMSFHKSSEIPSQRVAAY